VPDGSTPSGLQIPHEPLFHPNLEKDYLTRGSEVQFAILAMAGRLNARGPEVDDWCEANAHRARELALGRILAGDVRLSTIQAFVLLSWLDFTSMCRSSSRTCFVANHDRRQRTAITFIPCQRRLSCSNFWSS
jgi:hypothetical protein